MLWSTIKFALSRMAFSLGSADYHNCLEGSTAHCVEQFQLWSIAICKLPSQTKVVIMSTNISPVIIEILFGSRVLFFFRGIYRKLLEFCKVPSKRSYGMFTRAVDLLKRRPCPSSYQETKETFFSVQDQVKLIRWTGCRVTVAWSKDV